MPSSIAIGTAKYSDHSGGARPPKMNTTVSSSPKTIQTARYRTSRLRRLRIGCMERSDQFFTSIPPITTMPCTTRVLVGTTLVGRRLSTKPPSSVVTLLVTVQSGGT